MRVSLLGPPGSGKGTQAARLSARFGLAHVSTGEVFRDEIARCTDLGRRIAGAVEAGLLVDDATVNEVVFGRLDTLEGFVLDGYPRSRFQAESLDGYLGTGRRLDGVVFLDVDRDEVVRRLGGRLSCPSCGYVRTAGEGAGSCPGCGAVLVRRADDSPEVILKRIGEYMKATEPLVEHYGSRLLRIDGSGTIEEVWAGIEKAAERWA
jgi:adenylate kinase